MSLASLQFTPANQRAHAAATDNVMGWAWADSIGWISLNSENVGACNQPQCGSYGVNLDPVTRQINGFAWSDHTGWICFGTSCSDPQAVDCNGLTPVTNSPPTAYIDAGNGSVAVHGWAKVCNEKNDGWISLNCAEAGAGVCATVAPYYHVVFNPSTGKFSDPLSPGSSFAWNGTDQQTGLGYIDFQYAYVQQEKGVLTCADKIDNDMNGLIDCKDPQCATQQTCIDEQVIAECKTIADCAKPLCSSNLANTLCNESATNPVNPADPNNPTGNICADGIDNNNNGLVDCQEPACQSSPLCAETPTNPNIDQVNNLPVCADGIDNDGSGASDCGDAKCATYPACQITGEAAAIPNDPTTSCSDGIDNPPANGLIDCADPTCMNVPICTPAWIQAKFGDVYAKAGIDAKGSESTYCLSSKGTITGFTVTSGYSCKETATDLTLPSAGTNYKGTLGSLDIVGIKTGRYGKVVELGATSLIPSVLDGKVYHVNGNYTLNTTTFKNGIGATQRGNGLLFVDGGNLTISGDLKYESQSFSQYLRNLASFGIIVTKGTVGSGGSVIIDPGVKEIVGAYFAEESINTGAGNQPLQVLGLMAARKFNLERTSAVSTQASENIIFDGRAVANPPPGMQSVPQSLPTSKNAF